MTPQDLRNAANGLETEASRYESLASEAKAAGRNITTALRTGVAIKLRDCAVKIHDWADQAEHTGEVTPEMETGTAKFLQYAGV